MSPLTLTYLTSSLRRWTYSSGSERGVRAGGAVSENTPHFFSLTAIIPAHVAPEVGRRVSLPLAVASGCTIFVPLLAPPRGEEGGLYQNQVGSGW